MTHVNGKRAQLEHEYSTALRDCVGGGGELSLTHAYELGRMAAGTGIGVVELAVIHEHALRELLGDHAPPAEVDQFLAEALSPFEMTHRGFREANERLEAAVRELESFSYSVSHDLRAPLRTISAFTQALAEELGPHLDDKARDHVRRVLAAAARMNELIDALLELSRISRAPIGRHQVDLTLMAQAVLDDLRRRDPDRRVAIDIAPGLEAHVDGRLVRILLDNLLGHAWRATVHADDPRIEIGGERRDGESVFFVRDNGAGFDVAAVERLFTPFQRLPADRDQGATGIGLATARRVVERHGGRIWADSAPGRGATFFFTFGR